MSQYALHHGDCLEVMKGFVDNSIDAVVTDPPYFKVKGEWWDRQWDTSQGFIEWIGLLCEEWYRILKPNGSLYVFASPKMAARVEVKIAESFNVLNHIVWRKPPYSTKAEMFDKPTMRAFFPSSERIIFAEHYGADGYAKGEAGYSAKCDELRGFVFEPLRAYLAGERDRAGFTNRMVDEALGNFMSGHYFGQSQWALPTAENYQWLRDLFNQTGGEHLRREYEELRREYEELRRPFAVTADVPYTDVWDFPTVSYYSGKHPCEKPAALIRHIIEASTKAGAVVLDCFMGSGVTGEVCRQTGRDFVGIEIDEKYFKIAERRIREAYDQPLLFEGV